MKQVNSGLDVATRTIDKFVDLQSGAINRINNLESQIHQYRDHINELKVELHNACKRDSHQEYPTRGEMTSSNQLDVSSEFQPLTRDSDNQNSNS